MNTSTDHTATFDVDGLRQAIEARDAGAQLAVFAPDAVLTVTDHEHPPTRPLTLAGTDAIAGYLSDVCDRDMTHRVRTAVATDNRLTIELACAYPDGTAVLCMSVAGLDGDRIAWQRIVQAWDH
jgi:SnoaL-like domain